MANMVVVTMESIITMGITNMDITVKLGMAVITYITARVIMVSIMVFITDIKRGVIRKEVERKKFGITTRLGDNSLIMDITKPFMALIMQDTKSITTVDTVTGNMATASTTSLVTTVGTKPLDMVAITELAVVINTITTIMVITDKK